MTSAHRRSDAEGVSVVIPARNAATFLHDCLMSVQAQVHEGPLEIVVVDDGSTDATAAVAQAFPGVRCLCQPARGPSAARNAGIAAARHGLIAFLDADDLWPAGKLQVQLALLRQHPQAALVFGDCRQFDARGPWPQTEFERGALGSPLSGPGALVPEAYARLLSDNFITTGSVVVRRAVLAELGGFADDLRLVEDLDLWLRIARQHPIACCAEVCLLRRRHQDNASRDASAMGLAYLQVLGRQPADAPGLGRQIADAHVQLAELAGARGRAGAFARHAVAACAAAPGVLTFRRLAGALLRAVRGERRIEGTHGVG